MSNIKKTISRIPIIGSLAKKLYLTSKKASFSDSSLYWEQRYASNDNSGSGSYNHLAEFKAEILNKFIKINSIDSVIEFGCGDGNQLLLANYTRYIGLDVSKTAISLCASKFSHDVSKSFFLYDPKCFFDNNSVIGAELVLSLDVIYHLVEDDVFNLYIEHLFKSASRYVILYSTDTNDADTFQLPHVKHREFSEYINKTMHNWELLERIPNKYSLNKFPDNGSDAEFFIYARKS